MKKFACCLGVVLLLLFLHVLAAVVVVFVGVFVEAFAK